MLDSLYSLLQFTDGLFPSGGFAHSFGLEAYAQSGLLKSREDAFALIAYHLEAALAPCDGAAVALALEAARLDDLKSLCRLDLTLDAMKVARQFREASRQMGRQMLRVAVGCVEHPVVMDYSRALESEEAQGHHAIVFGLVGACRGWEKRSAITAFLYSGAALLTHAAVRLIPLGQRDGQWLLTALEPCVSRLTETALERGEDDLSSFEPALEIRGMQHERFDGRMFRS